MTWTLSDALYRQLDGWRTFPEPLLAVNAMTAYAASNYQVRVASETERLQQRVDFLALLDRLGTATEEETDRALDERGPAAHEPELSEGTAAKMRVLIERAKQTL